MTDDEPKTRRVFITVVVVLGAYLAGYGVLRWRKLLIHIEPVVKDRPDPVVVSGAPPMIHDHRVVAGMDLRTTGVGWIKNQIAEPMAMIYFPLCQAEALVWELLDSD